MEIRSNRSVKEEAVPRLRPWKLILIGVGAVTLIFGTYEIVERMWLVDVDARVIYFLHIIRGIGSSFILAGVVAWYLLRQRDLALLPPSPKVNVFQKFLLILFAAIGVTAVLYGLVFFRWLKENLLEREVQVTAEVVRVITNVDLNEEIFTEAVMEGNPEAFERVVTRLTSIPEIIRVKVYDAKGTIVWSDEARAIGKNFRDNRELQEALKGKVRVEMGLLKSEHVFEAERFPERRLLEIYVPLLKRSGGSTYGVFEIYKYPLSSFQGLDRSLYLVWLLSGLIGVTLFFSLSWIFLRAVREERRLHEANRQIEAELVQAEKLAIVGEVAAGLSHEINNPLALIMAHVKETLSEARAKEDSTELVTNLEVIDKNIIRIAETVRNLLTLARKSDLHFLPLDLNEVIRETLMLVEGSWMQTHHTVESSLATYLPPIRGNRNQLQQVLLNLFRNARDAMPQGGRITVKSCHRQSPEHAVVVEVTDHGGGIAPEVINKIFDPFFTTKEVGKGVGLGLAVSRRIVKNHGGNLWVESEPGHGATFKVAFPCGDGYEQQ